MPPPSETPKITLYRILGRIPAHGSEKNHFGRRGTPGKALDVREHIAPKRKSTFADAYQTNQTKLLAWIRKGKALPPSHIFCDSISKKRSITSKIALSLWSCRQTRTTLKERFEKARHILGCVGLSFRRALGCGKCDCLYLHQPASLCLFLFLKSVLRLDSLFLMPS